jgi:hypothetical protein
VLRAGGIDLLGRGLLRTASLPVTGGASSLLAAGTRLIVGGRDGIEVFDLSTPGAPRREREYPHPACGLFVAPATLDTRSVVFSRAEGGGGTLVGVTPNGLLELARYPQDPWFHRAAFIDDSVARLDPDGLRIALLRISATRER